MTSSLSGWWASESHHAMRGAATDVTRLAIALTPVRSIVRVVDDSVPPMSVDWCQIGNDPKGKPMSKSYTDFAGGRIAINPLPILDRKLDTGKAIDIVAGFALHEASHAKHSRDRWKYLLKKDPSKGIIGGDGQMVPAFEPMRIASYLWNVAEDVRIERATSSDWHGFADYFTAVLDWMWHDPEVASVTGDDPWLAFRISLLFHAVRYPTRIAEYRWAAEQSLFLLQGKRTTRGLMAPKTFDIDAEVAWWQAWQHDYLTDVTDVPTMITQGLDHLALDPKTAASLEKMAEEERKEREAGEKVRKQIERLMAEGVNGAPMVCINEQGEVRVLSQKEADQVNDLVKQGLVEVTPAIGHGNGSKKPRIRIRKPVETSASRRAYIGKPDAATEALRASLVFRSERPRYDIKLQKTGELDDEELYRWGMGDNRLFTDRVIEAVPDTLLGLLVDLSGSMQGGDSNGNMKLETAQRLAQMFLWATHDMAGVSTRVWGHTGDIDWGDRTGGAEIYRLWEPGDPMSRLGLISELPHGNNYDSYAVWYCAEQMRSAEQPQKVLLVLSDGYPAGSDYGGREAEQHIRTVVNWAASQGVSVVQVAIDSELRPADQERMYGPGNWITYTSEKQLPRDLERVLARFVK